MTKFGYSTNPLSIEDPNKNATYAQLKYIQDLATQLEFSNKQRDAHISSILFKEFNWFSHSDYIRKNEASLIIDKFKEWLLVK